MNTPRPNPYAKKPKPAAKTHGGLRVRAGRPKGSKNKPKSGNLQKHNTVLDHYFNDTVPLDEDEDAPNEQDTGTGEDSGADESDKTEKDRKNRERMEAYAKKIQDRRASAIEQLRTMSAELKDGPLFTDLEEGDSDADHSFDYNGDYDSVDSRRRSNKYIPSRTSAIGAYLDGFRKDIADPRKATIRKTDVLRGRHWFPPPQFDPVGRSKRPDPVDWYLSTCWVYVFLPFQQNQHLCCLEDICCLQCQETEKEGKFHGNGYHWRPMITLNGVVWLLHRRLECQTCKRTFAEFDPDIMSQIPNRISERFEFVTTRCGPGVDLAVVNQLIFLLTKSVGVGTFAAMLNEGRQIKHTMEHLSHADALLAFDQNALSEDVKPATYSLISTFGSMDGYCGVKVTVNLLKSIVESFMKAHEQYMQIYHEAAVDEGAITDDSHKMAKSIRCQGRKGKIFTGNRSVMAQHGRPTINRFMYTKSNEEFRPVMELFKKSRENFGAPPFLRIEADNPDAVRNEWERHFDSLSSDVTRYSPRPKNLPTATIDMENVVCVKDLQAAKNVAVVLKQLVDDTHGIGDGEFIFGLDLEWCIGIQSGVTCLLQVSFPGSPVYLFHLVQMGIELGKGDFSRAPELRDLLADKRLRAAGCQMGEDVKRLRDLGLNITYRLEIRHLAKILGATKTGLADITERYFHVFVDKSHQTDDWSQVDLPISLQRYAALDALLARLLGKYMWAVANSTSICGNLHVPPSTLKAGTEAEIFNANKRVATVIMKEIGNHLGQASVWGHELLVGAGKAIVKVKEVHVPAWRPQFDFVHPSDENLSWKRKETTIGDLFAGYKPGTEDGPEVVVRTSSLRQIISIDEGTSVQELQTFLLEQPAESTLTSTTNNSKTGVLAVDGADHTFTAGLEDDGGTNSVNSTQIDCVAEDEAEALLTRLSNNGIESVSDAQVDLATEETSSEDGDYKVDDDDYDYEEDDDLDEEYMLTRYADLLDELPEDCQNALGDLAGQIRSRMKGDLWHDYHDLPTDRASPVTATILALLIFATLYFDKQDLGKVVEYLSESKGILDWKKHFRFNREWWKMRVRMLRYNPIEHSARIRLVHNFVRDHLAKYYKPEMEKYFDNLERKALKGYYHELKDVKLYRPNGTDSNGLRLWLRLGGSTRLENYHQKMHVCVGPWGVGIKFGHFLLVLLSYRYSVNAGIKRLGHHNFGHPYLHLIDRLQNVYQQLFNVLIYPRHRNMSRYQATEGYTPVGVGPLSLNEDYVKKGKPLSILKGDLRFLAERMELECPPLPMGHEDEYKIFTRFIARQPKVTEKAFVELAKLFKLEHEKQARKIASEYQTTKQQAADQQKRPPRPPAITIYPKLVSMTKSYYKKTYLKSQAVRNIEKSVEKEFNDLVDKLVDLNKEAPNQEEHTQTPVVVDGTAPIMNTVAPLTAPNQAARVEARIPQSANAPRFRSRCFYYPYCNRFIDDEDCGGRKQGYCRRWNKGELDLEQPPGWPHLSEQFKTRKREATNEIKKRRMQEKRRKKNG